MTEHRPRIYGSDHDDPDPYTLTLGHDYVELVGGPLDGQLLDVTGLTDEECADGALLICLPQHVRTRRSRRLRTPPRRHRPVGLER
jgi:hypothetical protein